MATQTRSHRYAAAPQRRFARNTTAPGRGPALRRRRQPQPTGLKKVLAGMLPSGAAKKAAPSSKKGAAGGLAVVAAAAGVAFKNRDKLAQLRQKRSATTAPEGAATAPPMPGVGSSSSGL
jgi:hypothetical protein